MIVYDCDDEDQFAELQRRDTDEELTRRAQLQSFSPDTSVEARNRGYRPR
jgi:hypothetical protein